jgi:UDP-N-acetylmuramate--alanine ligase
MNKDANYFFIGIKGSGMSALALVLHEMGYKVSGSDVEKYFFTQRELEKNDVTILPFNAENIQPGMEIILGNAFKDDHPEVVRAKELGLTITRYHEFLGQLIENYISIGVAGAHGKTSTTGLLAHVMSGIAPTSYLIGDGTGHGDPNAKYFAFEADEYERHFMPYHPDYTIITNVDFDHPDYYESIDDVFSAFQDYAKQVKQGIFAYGDDPYLRKLDVDVPVYYYGENETDDFRVMNLKRDTTGSTFDIFYDGDIIGRFTVPTFGHHNVMNAAAVIAVAFKAGINLNLLAAEMKTFGGVKRRFSEKQVSDMVIIDDFAHHPAEIKATLDAARQKFPGKKIIAVFQPHTFSRTIALMDEFAEALEMADEVYLGDIYGSAREKQGDVKIEDLAAKVSNGGTIVSEDNMSPLLKYHNEVVVFMGAGDIQKFEFAYEQLLANNTRNVQ